MNKRLLATIYSIVLGVGLLASELFLLAKYSGTNIDGIKIIGGLLLALLFVTSIHELGHILFAMFAKMRIVYAKLSCFTFTNDRGRYALKLANPFLADVTQVAPRSGGNMRNRASLYAIGGLVFSFVLIVVLALLGGMFNNTLMLGMLPYATYIFLLNAAPLEYPSGKTDFLVFWGILRKEPSEKAMIMAMDIQGRLHKESRFEELPEELFDFPVLCEDDPIFLLCWDLKYRRALDKDDLDGAADCIKRLSQAEEYMNSAEHEKLAAELTYLHALNGDFDKANEACKYCEVFLSSKTASAKRILATVALLSGKMEEAELLIESGLELLKEIEIYGERKLEEHLLQRINTEDLRKLKKENDYGTDDQSV